MCVTGGRFDLTGPLACLSPFSIQCWIIIKVPFLSHFHTVSFFKKNLPSHLRDVIYKCPLPCHRIQGKFFFDAVNRKSKNLVDDVNDSVCGTDIRFDDVSCDTHAVDCQSLVVRLVVEPKLNENKINFKMRFTKFCQARPFLFLKTALDERCSFSRCKTLELSLLALKAAISCESCL